MKAVLTEEQTLLVDTAQRIAASGLADAQRVASGKTWPEATDSVLFSDWIGLGIPESDGGAGGGVVELGLLLKALNVMLVPSSFPTHAIAMQVARAAGLPLDKALNGQSRWCLAVTERGAKAWGPFATSLDQGTLSGSKPGVFFGAQAHHAVVLADEQSVALAQTSEAGMAQCADLLTPSADLVFDKLEPDAVGTGAQLGLQIATALTAAELCGVAHGAIQLATEYAQSRAQFGRPIGAFQGVAHQLAEALVASETAWSLTLYACWALDQNKADATAAVHAAKAKASQAAVFASERALQVHGGMGMTWEASPHLFLRRALTRSAWLGAAHWHRRWLGQILVDKHRNHPEVEVQS